MQILLEAHALVANDAEPERTTGRAQRAGAATAADPADDGRTQRIGICMPLAKWPGMGQPTSHAGALAPAAAEPEAGTVQVWSIRSPDRTTMRSPASSDGTVTTGV